MEDGITSMCQQEAGEHKQIKAGLKVGLGSLIRLASKVLIADFIIKNRNEEAKEIELFQKVFNLSENKGNAFVGYTPF